MRAPRIRLLLLFVLPLLTLAVLISDQPVPPPPSPPEDKPRALVGMGDSTMSGEGAGDYEPGTHGENGNWCHRSPNALIHRTALPGIEHTINLACSGARASNVSLEPGTHNTEPSQAAQLGELARQYRIVAIVVAVGANDDPRFSDVVLNCMQAWAKRNDPGCATTVGEQWQERVDRMVPKVVRALQDIRQVMRRAGYPDNSYSLVLQSYATPVGPDIAPGLQDLSGCPFRTSDLEWVRGTAVRELAAGLHRAAQAAGARFLDLSDAATGYEACTRANAPQEEWFTRLTVDWDALRDEQRAPHAVQESFHPNARGHSQFGRCLGEFLATTHTSAACLPGPDGYLHPVPGRATADSRTTG